MSRKKKKKRVVYVVMMIDSSLPLVCHPLEEKDKKESEINRDDMG